MTSKRRENKNLVSFICFSFLVIRFSKQLLTFNTQLKTALLLLSIYYFSHCDGSANRSHHLLVNPDEERQCLLKV